MDQLLCTVYIGTGNPWSGGMYFGSGCMGIYQMDLPGQGIRGQCHHLLCACRDAYIGFLWTEIRGILAQRMVYDRPYPGGI